MIAHGVCVGSVLAVYMGSGEAVLNSVWVLAVLRTTVLAGVNVFVFYIGQCATSSTLFI